MLTCWLLFTFPFVSESFLLGQPASEVVARAILVQHGAWLKPKSCYSRMGLPDNQAQQVARSSPEVWVTFVAPWTDLGDKGPTAPWTGGKEKLKYLRYIPNLTEILFDHEDFTPEWCEILDHLPRLKAVFFCGENVTDQAIAHVAGLKELEYLSLLSTSATDKSLQFISDKRKLRFLNLEYAKISDEGLIHLKHLTNLEVLFLEGTYTTGKGLKYLKNMKSMRKLRFSDRLLGPMYESGVEYLSGMTEMMVLCAGHSNVNDADLASLQNMKKLEFLDLGDNEIYGSGLANLKGHNKLKTLILSETGLTSEALEFLENLENLEGLEISHTLVDDDAIKHILKMRSLRVLGLNGTAISQEAVAQLKRDRPKLGINHDDVLRSRDVPQEPKPVQIQLALPCPQIPRPCEGGYWNSPFRHGFASRPIARIRHAHRR